MFRSLAYRNDCPDLPICLIWTPWMEHMNLSFRAPLTNAPGQ
jgi:hypothetical protein